MKTFRIYILAFLFILVSENISVAQQIDSPIKNQIDSLLKLPDDTNKVNALNDLIWKINTYDSSNTMLAAKKSIALSIKINYLKGLATAQKNLAAYYYYSADYEQALELYQICLKNYDSCQYKKGIAISYRNIGNVYSQLGATKEALKNYFKSLEIREEIKDSMGLAKTYSAIGLLYTNTNDYKDSSLLYFNRALTIFQKKNSIYNITSTYINISSLYYSLFTLKYDTIYFKNILEFAQKSLKLSKENQLYRFEAIAYEIMGESYRITGKSDSAYYYLKLSLEVRQKDNNVFGIVNSLSKLGTYFLLLNNYNKAEKYFVEALKLSNNIGTGQISQDIYKNLSELYSKTGDYKKAYDNFVKYNQLKDSLQNQQNTKQLTQMAMQYEFDKKQKIQELIQQKKDALTQAEIKRQRVITYFLILGLLFMLILAFVIFRSYKQKQKTNKLLREKNEQINIKNAQLNQRNEEIEAQKDEIEAQKDEIEAQKDFLEKQNKEITASINYAERIQRAVLTPISFFEDNFDDFFILYKPRDIVSGDFYWATKLGNKIIVTAADSTGHGVPGAFMSLLGISFLNQIVNQEYEKNRKNYNSASILNKLRDMIILSLGHGAEENTNQEGMDMALLIIDFTENTIEFAGAYNPLVIVKNNEMEIIAADRMPVGYHFRKMQVPFTNKKISFEKGSNIYMFSDGFQDQFGGNDGKKVTPKILKEKILENNSFTMGEQKDKLIEFYDNWIGKNDPINSKFPQIDDILVMGIKL